MTAPVNIDMDVLRTFVAGTSLGSFAKAADRLGRSPSAISLQLRKLEGQVGQALFCKQGRGLALTESGELMLSYARRILELNDEAVTALRGIADMEGWVRLGLPQDFAETGLPTLLGRFARAHPKVRVEARVDRGSALIAAVERGQLDLALTWGDLRSAHQEVIARYPIVWIGLRGFQRNPDEPLPLVAFDPPCSFRSAAVEALDQGGIAWRHTFASPSLAGLWAAVSAGLGITPRTAEGVPQHLCALDETSIGLPSLGALDLVLHSAEGQPRAPVARLRALLADTLVGSFELPT